MTKIPIKTARTINPSEDSRQYELSEKIIMTNSPYYRRTSTPCSAGSVKPPNRTIIKVISCAVQPTSKRQDFCWSKGSTYTIIFKRLMFYVLNVLFPSTYYCLQEMKDFSSNVDCTLTVTA